MFTLGSKSSYRSWFNYNYKTIAGLGQRLKRSLRAITTSDGGGEAINGEEWRSITMECKFNGNGKLSRAFDR